VSRQLTWVDRSGNTLAKVGDPDATAQSADPAISPDNRRVAVWRTENGNPDVWLLDATDGRRVRFTSEQNADMFPLWSGDGDYIVFGSNRTGNSMEIYKRPATGSPGEELLLSNGAFNSPLDTSRDGRYLLYGKGSPAEPQNLFVINLTGDRKSIPVAQSKFDERLGQFSPDGKWIAYQSDESGRFEIYVQPFPGPGAKIPISTSGGTQARWRPDGKELYFVAPEDRFMAVPLRTSGGTIEAATPLPLFAAHVSSALQFNLRQQYAVSLDGQRFLVNKLFEDTVSTPMTLLLNWPLDRK